MLNEMELLEDEIKTLKTTLREKEQKLKILKSKLEEKCPYTNYELSSNEVTRYSRQMIMPHIQLNGQVALKRSKILIVGAGGLGCPSSIYLAAAGVGEIHIVDYDEVELSNLHRQILHTESDIGIAKDKSIQEKLIKINSNIKVVSLHLHADSSIVEHIQKNNYNVVIDCTDNVPTRYLLNDVCVLYNIPLVSGSALQMEGQLTVYNYKNGPCYRCLFPVPPPAHTVTNCGDGGVLGAVPGVIGVLQALEAIKIIMNSDDVLSQRLLLFDGAETIFRNIKLRSKVANCAVCGDNPTITSPIDYELFCGSKAHDKVINISMLNPDENIRVEDFANLLMNSTNHIVLDVRPKLEFLMCKLPKTINLPYTKIKANKDLEELQKIIELSPREELLNVYVICRRGNDSQRSVEELKEKFSGQPAKFLNVKGGLHAYSKFVDASFPVY